jgi:hypothetical protein
MGKIAEELVGVSVGKWAETNNFKVLKKITHGRLIREVRLNKEILNDSWGTKAPQTSVFMNSLSSHAFDLIIESGMPLETIFEKKLQDKVKAFFKKNKKIETWTSGLTTEATLIERAYHRLKVAKIKVSLDLDPGDLNYLRYLFVAIDMSLTSDDR